MCFLLSVSQLGIKIDSDKAINIMINVANICIKEFDESCSDSY